MKNIYLSGIISLIINIVGMFINYQSYLTNKHLLLSFKRHGGEITYENGFGISVIHKYAMNMNQSDTHTMRFSLIGLIVSLVVVFMITYLLITVIRAILKK